MKKKVVVLVDHQNILAQAQEGGVSIENIYSAILLEAQKSGEVIDVRAFVPAFQDSQGQESWRTLNQLAIKFGISVEACAVLREKSRYKDVVDLAVLRWVTEYGSAEFDVAMLVTGDADFIIAANELKKRGKEVIGRVTKFNNAGMALFSVLTMEELDLTTGNLLVAKPDNPFLATLAKVVGGEEKLGKEEKKRLKTLAKTEALISLANKEWGLGGLTAYLSDKLKVGEQEARLIIETLATMDIVQFRPTMILGITSHPSTKLQSLEALLKLNNNQ